MELLTTLLSWIYALPAYEPAVGIPLAGAALVLALLWATARRNQVGFVEPRDREAHIRALIASNRYEEAGQMRLEEGQFNKALALFTHACNLPKVALCHLSLKQPRKAAEVYLELGRPAEAGHYFQMAGAWLEAAQCLEGLGSLREAAELYERAGELAKAARQLKGLGDAENAARLFGRAGLHSEEALALLDAHGRTPTTLRRAGELLESVGEARRAAECFAGAADWLRAAELFEGIEEYSLAGQAFERAESWSRAGAAYERAGAHPEARTNYERAGDTLCAAQLAQRVGNLLDAGRGFYRLGSYEHAIEMLQGVTQDSPQARGAAQLLGRIFLEKGLFARAKDKLDSIAPEQRPTQEDLEGLLLLAEAHERLDEVLPALHRLEQIVERDPNYQDVAERLERLQERAWGGSTMEPTNYFNNRYELRDEIGRGGMGIVHLAQDRELGRPVAIKFLPRDLAAQASAVRMFRHEARAAASMNHPNIVHVYDVAVIGCRPCIVMEYVQGKTVRHLMRAADSQTKTPLAPDWVASIVRDICYALAYAHEQHVIHRDVKPGNMLIPDEGGAKLMDFGISKVLEAGSGGSRDTQTRGTPQYMPPEQVLGHNIDGRTDLYALGISTYEMLTGQRPFRGKNILEQQLKRPIPDPREIKPDIPAGLVPILLKATEKQPEDRYASATEMAAALNAYLQQTNDT